MIYTTQSGLNLAGSQIEISQNSFYESFCNGIDNLANHASSHALAAAPGLTAVVHQTYQKAPDDMSLLDQINFYLDQFMTNINNIIRDYQLGVDNIKDKFDIEGAKELSEHMAQPQTQRTLDTLETGGQAVMDAPNYLQNIADIDPACLAVIGAIAFLGLAYVATRPSN